MYINKYTHEVFKDCDLTLEHAYDKNCICVPDGATFATGTSFDGDFVWRDDFWRYDSPIWVDSEINVNNVSRTGLELLWIHPDVKQKMLQGEIPNQITEKEWMRFDYNKLIGCQFNIVGYSANIIDANEEFVYYKFNGGSTSVELRVGFLQGCLFYLEDGTMVRFEEYKGVYYND